MRAAIALLSCLVACTDPGSNDDGSYVELEITSDVAFDELLIFNSHGGTTTGPGIVTPGLLAAGQPAPASAMITSLEGGLRRGGSGKLATRYTYENWSLVGTPHDLAVLAVVTQPDGTLQPVAYGDTGRLQYMPKDGAATEASGTLALVAFAGTAEVWGVESCLRLVDTVGSTRYLVSLGDRDCDGIDDQEDCAPDAFCSATTPTEHDLCIRGSATCSL